MREMILGDCLDLLREIPSRSIDMVLTDLPYGTTRNKWDSIIPLAPLRRELLRVTTPRAPIVMTAQMPFTAILVSAWPDLYRHHWVWEKGAATGHLNAKRAPMKAHEDVLVFSTGQPTPYNPQKTEGHARKVSTAHHKRASKKTTNWGDHGLTTYDSTSRYPRSVIRFSTDKQKSPIHPTQKPVALFEYLIRTYSNPGACVLDVASGSGTTAVAADLADRDWVCIEEDEGYYRASLGRVCVSDRLR